MFTSTVSASPGYPTRVLIVDDHPLYCDALESALQFGFNSSQIRKAFSLKEAFEILDEDFDPDLVMFDLKLPDVTGISGFRALKERVPNTRILVISSLASPELVQSLLGNGADGFLPKDASAATLKYAVNEVAVGRKHIPQQYCKSDPNASDDFAAFRSNPALPILTAQQIRIMKLICAGKPNKLIAYELSLAEATVKAHITALLRRLGVRNRTQAVVFVEDAMMRHGGSEPEARAFLKH